jgi:putative hydrolase of the HAD superfamily
MTLEQSRLERFRRLLERSGVSPTDEQVAEITRFYHQAYLDSDQPVAGALNLLKALRQRGHKIGVVTNNIAAEQVKKIRACGMEELIDELVVSEEAGACKPDPAIFRVALERLDCRPEEAVMIGDAWATDIAGARAAGIRAIWFNPRGLPSPDPTQTREIRALEPVEALLEVIYGKENKT